MRELEKIVKSNILDYGLIKKGDSVLVGLSGGPDSTALLHILKKLSKTIGFTLAACYINHMIRPRAVKKEIEFCWSLCDKLKIDFHIINEDIPRLAAELKMSVETAGHEFRREALKQLAYEDDYNCVALAHHGDDLIETIIFRLFRGTGPQGLNPMKIKNDIFIRPLLSASKEEIEEYCRLEKINTVIDKSNFDPKYTRNYIRHKIIPVIEQHFGGKYKNAIVNISRIITEENEYLSGLAAKKYRAVTSVTDGGKVIVDLEKFIDFDNWMKRRIVKMILEDLSGYFGAGSFDDIERVIDLVYSSKKSHNLPLNTRVIKEINQLIFIADKCRIHKREFMPGDNIDIEELGTKYICREKAVSGAVKKVQKDGYKINIDFDKVTLPLIARGIKTGDRFRPLGMKGSKKVGNFLTDWKVPAYIRDEIIVIEDKEGIIWLAGYQIADRVRIDNSTKRILEIERVGQRRNKKA